MTSPHILKCLHRGSRNPHTYCIHTRAGMKGWRRGRVEEWWRKVCATMSTDREGLGEGRKWWRILKNISRYKGEGKEGETLRSIAITTERGRRVGENSVCLFHPSTYREKME